MQSNAIGFGTAFTGGAGGCLQPFMPQYELPIPAVEVYNGSAVGDLAALQAQANAFVGYEW